MILWVLEGKHMAKAGSQVENPYYEQVNGRWVPTEEGRRQIGALICRAYGVTQYEVRDMTSTSPTETPAPEHEAAATDPQEEVTR
jgi:hypothetical protein